ncbi:SDR family NAD(P)-dependent oxidoreductase [Methylophaga sp. OBS3]|uniref:SDR family NAD(P)-dependent oxidoreductase n=1 Tax=Methylophaga sp. OBS3 TaxID=2991934 RepID=UPI002251D1C0|nr:SDR family NAD(P)-dependent oxidoreductase [Methylophaga sp. OBS3]MCX4190721.1 SDR family NAD(P)-dependent oxidoreductase [Methylophaga sp. OBS3]
MKNSPKRKHILITGCSSGIGLEAAKLLHDRGHKVVASVRNEKDIKQFNDLGIPCVILDLDCDNSIQQGLEESLSLLDGRIDALFNNGAYGQPGAVEDLTRDVLQAQFNTNLFGTQVLTNAVIKVMRQQGHGRIIYNSSVLGLIALPYRGAYNASKFALEGLADTLRLELRGTGIEVSLIEPGPILSQFRANAFAKYQQNIDKTNSAHRQIYQAMENRLTKSGPAAPFTLPASAVVDKLIHAVEAKRPQLGYYVTFPTYLLGTLKRILPGRALDWVLKKISRGEQS